MARRFNLFAASGDQQPKFHGVHEELHNERRLLYQIDIWEYNSIAKIKQTADIVRRELRKLLYDAEARTGTIAKLHEIRLQGDFGEIESASWKEPLFNPRKELEKPLHIDIVHDKYQPPIYLIKLEAMKEDVFTPQAYETPRQLNVLLEDIDLSSKKSSTPPLDSRDIQKDRIRFESENSLDPTKYDNLILLQRSSPDKSQLSTSLQKLTDGPLSILHETSALLTQSIQSTIIIDMFNESLKDLDKLLNEISQLKHIHSVYIRATPPENDKDRQDFFSKYPFIKAMFENEQSLIAQWAMDTANEYKKIGDMYIRKGEKEKAQIRFRQGVALYKRLSEFLKEKSSLK